MTEDFSTIRKFNFYQEYTWLPADFENMQEWERLLQQLNMKASGEGVAEGLDVTPQSGLTVQVSAGFAFNCDGQHAFLDAAMNATFASPSGNPAKSLLILRPKFTDQNTIAEPLNPLNNVPLHEEYDYDLLVLDGTPAAVPVYPATTTGDIVLMGVELAAAETTVGINSFDFSQRQVMGAGVRASKIITADYQMLVKDENIDLDCSGGVVNLTLPDPNLSYGRTFNIVKIDSSVNQGNLLQNGSELISGQPDWDLLSQWETVTVYSNGKEWRIL